MNGRGPEILVATLAALALAAGALLFGNDAASGQDHAGTEAFQRLVGGLGFGPAVDLSGCAFDFDPRLSGRCPQDLGPIPGGAWFCPHHGCSILYYPALVPPGSPEEKRAHGSSP